MLPPKDGSGHSCRAIISGGVDNDDDSEAETDDSNMGGLPEDCTHGTPEPMSTPISQVRSVTRRSCNGRAKISVCAQPANVVRAVS